MPTLVSRESLSEAMKWKKPDLGPRGLLWDAAQAIQEVQAVQEAQAALVQQNWGRLFLSISSNGPVLLLLLLLLSLVLVLAAAARRTWGRTLPVPAGPKPQTRARHSAAQATATRSARSPKEVLP